MFKVKITVVGVLGDAKTYPCHMGHKIGDEVIFDGGQYIGSLCPDVWPLVVPKVASLHQAGPRVVDWSYYYPFWYCSLSENDPGKKKYDGLGFRNVLKTINPPPHSLASLAPPNAFIWPPIEERTVNRDITTVCPDGRTAVVFKMEAFDICEGGYDAPFFRRQMAILAKLLAKKEIEGSKLIKTFTKQETEEIYPPLSPILLNVLAEELELMGYIKVQKGVLSSTPKGKDKLKTFKAGLTAKEREVFEKY